MSAPSFALQAVLHQPPRSVATNALVILLHGYGSNEDDLFGLAPYLDQRLTIVSARAPMMLRPGSYAWFEIGFTPQGIAVDRRGAQASLRVLAEFVQAVTEHLQIDPQRVCIAGFSQGATMAAALALTHPHLMQGIIMMSGIMPTEIVAEEPAAASNQQAFLVTHGLHDQVVPIAHGRASRDYLARLQMQVHYHEYPMGHEINLDCLKDVRAWLSAWADADQRKGA
jgi:phospholipase/carboxylesterase